MFKAPTIRFFLFVIAFQINFSSAQTEWTGYNNGLVDLRHRQEGDIVFMEAFLKEGENKNACSVYFK